MVNTVFSGQTDNIGDRADVVAILIFVFIYIIYMCEICALARVHDPCFPRIRATARCPETGRASRVCTRKGEVGTIDV